MKKDFIRYYKEVEAQYLEMMQDLRDMEKEMQDEDSMISPEMYAQLENMIKPLKTHYEILSYAVFLLNMPSEEKRREQYEKQNAEMLRQMKTAEEVEKENDKVLQDLKDSM